MPCYVGLGRPGPNIAFGRRGVAPPNPATAGWVEPRGGCAHSSQPQSRTLAPNQASPHPAMLAPAAPTQTLRLGGVAAPNPVASGWVEPQAGCAHSSQPRSRVVAMVASCPGPCCPICAAAAYPAAARPVVAWPPPALVVPALGGDKGGPWAAAVSASARCNTAHYPSC